MISSKLIAHATADSETCLRSMYAHLRDCGYAFSYEDFVSNYRAAVSEFRRTRNDHLREVNNCVWIASTLERMGSKVEPSHPHVVCAVERYFSPWQIALAPDAQDVLEELKSKFAVSLVSNFTDSTFIRRCLKGLGLEDHFAHIVISDSVGWRKPHPNIFKAFLDSFKRKGRRGSVHRGRVSDRRQRSKKHGNKKCSPRQRGQYEYDGRPA